MKSKNAKSRRGVVRSIACSEIVVTLKMEGKKSHCAKVRKQLVSRICEALREPENYIGDGEVNYEWTVHIKRDTGSEAPSLPLAPNERL